MDTCNIFPGKEPFNFYVLGGKSLFPPFLKLVDERNMSLLYVFYY